MPSILWCAQLALVSMVLVSSAPATRAGSVAVSHAPPAVMALAATATPEGLNVPAGVWSDLSCQERRAALRALAREAAAPMRVLVDGRLVAAHDGRVVTFFPDPEHGEPQDLQMLRDTNDPAVIDVPPALISMPAVEYPQAARERGIEGSLALRALVGTGGRVEEIVLPRGAEVPGLTEAALAAARDAVFEPARRADQPVAVWTLMPFQFVIE